MSLVVAFVFSVVAVANSLMVDRPARSQVEITWAL